MEEQLSPQATAAAPAAEDGLRAHYDGLFTQAEALRTQFPDLDLRRELENPRFVQLTSPALGYSVAEAYAALHLGEVTAAAAQTAARQTMSQVAGTLAQRRARPAENGGQTPSVTAVDPRSREYRNYVKQKMRDAAARGEKFYPSGR